MKNHFLEIEDKNYYCLEEITYNEKNYMLTVECNIEKDEIDNNNYIIMEYHIDNGEYITNPVVDSKEAEKILNLLISKIRK